jgi:putative transposase
VGSVCWECLDHVIVLGERHLGGILKSYFAYYPRSRTHLSLSKDVPEPREVCPPAMGKIVELPEVGGLHHRYERPAA